jgi:membrane protein YqaA with SNARE-associated domain
VIADFLLGIVAGCGFGSAIGWALGLDVGLSRGRRQAFAQRIRAPREPLRCELLRVAPIRLRDEYSRSLLSRRVC